jgi:hypothetical protein
MRDVEFVKFFFENYFPESRQVFMNDIELIYVQKHFKDKKYTCWVNVVNSYATHFVLGIGESKKDFKTAFVNSLDQVISLGIDTLLNEVLNPFSESENWRIFKQNPIIVQNMIKTGEIVYFKNLKNEVKSEN